VKGFVVILLSTFLFTAVSCGDNNSVDPPLRPSFIDVSATDVRQTEALLNATLDEPAGVDELWFEVFGDDDTFKKCVATMGADSIFHSNVKGLSSGSDYTFKAFAGNGTGLFFSSAEVSFETEKFVDTVVIANKAFREWILWNYDSNKDGALSIDEAMTVTHIDMYADEVTNIDEIKYFPNLQYLNIPGNRDISFRNGKIKHLDVSANRYLNRLEVTHNQLESVKFGYNPDLRHVDLVAGCLTEIDVSQLPSVTLLSVSDNNLTSFDARGMVSIEELHVNNNPITEVLVNNKSLRSLDCENTNIRVLDISGCTMLNELHCSKCFYLDTVYMAKGQILGSINVEPNTTIVHYE